MSWTKNIDAGYVYRKGGRIGVGLIEYAELAAESRWREGNCSRNAAVSGVGLYIYGSEVISIEVLKGGKQRTRWKWEEYMWKCALTVTPDVFGPWESGPMKERMGQSSSSSSSILHLDHPDTNAPHPTLPSEYGDNRWMIRAVCVRGHLMEFEFARCREAEADRTAPWRRDVELSRASERGLATIGDDGWHLFGDRLLNAALIPAGTVFTPSHE
ncbi:hypothetical protein DFH09DRAFT_1277684 [Mycena vulgaris]|nr:hypothetical protein DFH09DRAFT_1277684 [Mycena vulgaris]